MTNISVGTYDCDRKQFMYRIREIAEMIGRDYKRVWDALRYANELGGLSETGFYNSDRVAKIKTYFAELDARKAKEQADILKKASAKKTSQQAATMTTYNMARVADKLGRKFDDVRLAVDRGITKPFVSGSGRWFNEKNIAELRAYFVGLDTELNEWREAQSKHLTEMTTKGWNRMLEQKQK